MTTDRPRLTPPERLAARLGRPGWLLIAVVSIFGWGIGSAYMDLSGAVRWHWAYRGKRGRQRWEAKVTETKERLER